jgi:hypothetical protein
MTGQSPQPPARLTRDGAKDGPTLGTKAPVMPSTVPKRANFAPRGVVVGRSKAIGARYLR